MAYPNNSSFQKPYQVKSSEESLHWISFNLKKLTEEVKRIGDILSNATPIPTTPPQQPYRAPPQTYYQQPKEDQQLPF